MGSLRQPEDKDGNEIKVTNENGDLISTFQGLNRRSRNLAISHNLQKSIVSLALLIVVHMTFKSIRARALACPALILPLKRPDAFAL